MKTPAQVLRDAAALVERGWCQDSYARDADGFSVSPTAPIAVAWCAYGAIEASSGDGPTTPAEDALREVIHTYGVGGWNDARERTAAEVAAAMRKAADNLEAQ